MNAQIAQARKISPTIVQMMPSRVQPAEPHVGGGFRACACGISTSGVSSCSRAPGLSCTVSLTGPPVCVDDRVAQTPGPTNRGDL